MFSTFLNSVLEQLLCFPYFQYWVWKELLCFPYIENTKAVIDKSRKRCYFCVLSLLLLLCFMLTRHTHHLWSTFQNEKQKLSFLPRKIFHLQLLATKQSSKIKSNLNFNEKLAKVWKNFNFGYFGLH